MATRFAAAVTVELTTPGWTTPRLKRHLTLVFEKRPHASKKIGCGVSKELDEADNLDAE